MIKQESLERLIDKTLSNITCFHETTASDRHLVMFTMFMGDGGLINSGNPVTHGMFSWTYDQFADFINEDVKINQRLCDDINDICLVNVQEDTMEDLFEALAYNMAFQVMIVWGYYHVKMNEMPRDIDEVKKAYFNVWPNTSNVSHGSNALDIIKGWSV